jgi:hypothetical protein
MLELTIVKDFTNLELQIMAEPVLYATLVLLLIAIVGAVLTLHLKHPAHKGRKAKQRNRREIDDFLDEVYDNAYEVEPLEPGSAPNEWYTNTDSIPIQIDPETVRKAREESRKSNG